MESTMKIILAATLLTVIASASVANAGRLSEVPKAFRNVEWCNENDACIVFSRNALQFNTIDDAKPCPITSVNESPPRTYEINYECGGKGFIEKFILQSPERLVQRYWAKQPVGHWGYLLYTPR
jgi:hypothetical protein